MAFKDRFGKIVSYFDTDDVNEVEELESSVEPTPPVSAEPRTRPVQQAGQLPPLRPDMGTRPQASPVRERQPLSSGTDRSEPSRVQPSSALHPDYSQGRPSRPQAPTQTVSTSQGEMKIALKYPRRYEDAPAIVDLLLNNECVLIDFEHMLDAQARRCLDFLDGASKVLYGSLQKVGTTMYLLAPANVVVDIEELVGSRPQQHDASYNYDMPRR